MRSGPGSAESLRDGLQAAGWEPPTRRELAEVLPQRASGPGTEPENSEWPAHPGKRDARWWPSCPGSVSSPNDSGTGVPAFPSGASPCWFHQT